MYNDTIMVNNDVISEQPMDDDSGRLVEYHPGLNKLDSHNWLGDISEYDDYKEVVEVRFKNTRKGFYRNVGLELKIGDVVAVEASPGHDIGRISMVGRLVREEMKKSKSAPALQEMKKIYRIAKDVDIRKWEEAQKLEVSTMLRSREIADSLRLNMKIGDVEYQGDKTKAIFYYIADERVDFRQLIKLFAEEFKVKIEMRQIGARQEAGRIGGVSSCGRELCCSTYIKNFVSVTTTHAKYQELMLNPQKLAGQCGKLKCCLSFEVDCYIDAQKSFPPRELPLETLDTTLYFQKMEVHKGLYWYSTDAHASINLVAIPVDRVKEIQALNKRGIKADRVLVLGAEEEQPVASDLLENNSLTRFDTSNPQKKKRKKRHKNRQPNNNDARTPKQ